MCFGKYGRRNVHIDRTKLLFKSKNISYKFYHSYEYHDLHMMTKGRLFINGNEIMEINDTHKKRNLYVKNMELRKSTGN